MARNTLSRSLHDLGLSAWFGGTLANAEAFDRAVAEVAAASTRLLDSLVTTAPPKDREVEALKARERAALRYGT
jgi:hypothetical protein